MPFVYTSMTAQAGAGSFTTSGTADTEVDQMYVKPTTRNTAVQALIVGGKGAGLTALSGIAYRLKKFPTTASSGNAQTPVPSDPGAQAAKSAAGMASAGVTSGTGTPVYLCGCISGAAGPGGWVAANPDSMKIIEGSATQSIDLFTASGTISLKFDANIEFQE